MLQNVRDEPNICITWIVVKVALKLEIRNRFVVFLTQWTFRLAILNFWFLQVVLIMLLGVVELYDDVVMDCCRN